MPRNVLTLQASTIEGWWDRAVESVARGLEILRDDCGVLTPGWLPYRPIVMPFAAINAKVARPGSLTTGAIRQKLVRWFWCAVFGQTYDQGSNSQAAEDVGELLAWCAGGEPPESVSGFRFDPEVLRDVTSRQSALYRGAMCLVMSRGPRDFHSGAKLTGDLMAERHIDAHHIFPQTYLQRHGVAARLSNCVLNCTLIDRTTNQSLYTRAPADYLAQICTTLGDQHFRELLESHLLPSEPDSPLWRNDFEEFLARRQELLWQEIQRVTGLAHTPSRTEDQARPPLRIRGGRIWTPLVSVHEGV
jgi:hypothetical protein